MIADEEGDKVVDAVLLKEYDEEGEATAEAEALDDADGETTLEEDAESELSALELPL